MGWWIAIVNLFLFPFLKVQLFVPCMYWFLHRLDLFGGLAASAIVMFCCTSAECATFQCSQVSYITVMTSALSEMILWVGGDSHSKSSSVPSSEWAFDLKCSSIDVLISASSGFVWWVGCHSHRKAFLVHSSEWVFVYKCSHRFYKCFDFCSFWICLMGRWP